MEGSESMRVYDKIDQGSPEWFALRAGIPTASRFSEIVTGQGAKSATQPAYARELIGACFCPEFEYWGGNAHTRRGNELEPEARDQFMAETGLDVIEVGFCKGDAGISGCSPDGLILGDGKQGWIGGVEIKCPTPKVHVEYHIDGTLPNAYKQQVHGSMAITGLPVWHFWSYCRGMAPFHLEVKADAYTKQLAAAVAKFETYYKKMSDSVREKLIGNTQPENEIL